MAAGERADPHLLLQGCQVRASGECAINFKHPLPPQFQAPAAARRRRRRRRAER